MWKGEDMSEWKKFKLAMVAPVGITLFGLLLGVPQLFIGGLVFTGLVVLSG
jgi:hypothetical protein